MDSLAVCKCLQRQNLYHHVTQQHPWQKAGLTKTIRKEIIINTATLSEQQYTEKMPDTSKVKQLSIHKLLNSFELQAGSQGHCINIHVLS